MTGVWAAEAPALDCHPNHNAPVPFGVSYGWWAHGRVVSRRSFGLCPTGACGKSLGHQALAYSVRLENGSSRCSGRLEVKSNNSWSSVCEDDFDLLDAEVVCRELGCGAPSVLQGALYGEAEAPKWNKEFLCEGHESSLLDCNHPRLERSSSSNKVVDLTCSGIIRLEGDNGSSRCSGRLEVKSNNSWSSVCEDDFDLLDAEVVCRELGCGAPSVLQGALYGEAEAPILSREFLCEGHESVLLDCGTPWDPSTCTHHSSSSTPKLENGSSLCSGRLEVKSNNWWSSVCEDDFDLLDAEVVCRELGCGAPSVLQGVLYGEAEAPILSREFLCEGHESVLLDCGSSWRKTKASVSESGSAGAEATIPPPRGQKAEQVNGSSLCSGRLEVKSNNSWSSVCEDDFDLLDAEVVCRELDCGAPSVLQGALYGEAEAPILSREFFCEGHESVLLDCGSSWRKTKASVQSTSRDHRCSGRLEVKSNNWWSSVCEDDFDLLDAEVVCRDLGCGAPSVLQGALYGEAEAPILSREFLCEGHESVLLDCGSSWRKTKACPPDKAVGLTCSDSVRLENGSSRCSGRLEVKSNNSWSSVCEDDFDLLDAEVVCRELGCGAPSVLQGALYGEAEAPILSREFLCEGHESVLLDCGSSWRKTKACPPDKAVGLTCSDSVRLENGSSRCSGRLEVKSNNSWSSVCEDDFDLLDAEVVCRELGCGAPSVLQGALYGEAEAPILSREFLCEGHESVLLDCGSSWRKTKACPPDKAVGLTCSGTAANPATVRLMGSSRCSGELQVKIGGEWRAVDAGEFIRSQTIITSVCKNLKCGPHVSSTTKQLPREKTVFQIGSTCFDEFPLNMEKCVYYDTMSSNTLEITCLGNKPSDADCMYVSLSVCDASLNSVRLENGSSRCSGRLEVKSNNWWSSVCEDDFDLLDAEVVCRELGCGAPSVLQGALYGEAEAPILTREFLCEGHESVLLDCGSSWRKTKAYSVRLENGSSRCSGRLEVKSNNSWSSVCEDDFDLLDAEVVCRELGCGAPSVLQGALYGEAEAPILSREFLCEGHESVLLDCGSSWRKTKACPPDKAVGLTCSGTAANSVRLENGSSRCSGRLEVKSNNSWSSVCEDDFDLLDAEVVCRELGCGAPSVLQGALYGEAEAPIFSREFLCEGHESVLLDCGSSWRKTKACPPDKAVGLTCSGTAASSLFWLLQTATNAVQLIQQLLNLSRRDESASPKFFLFFFIFYFFNLSCPTARQTDES
uniref:SRCR domain-containing protein n=1 Tax=Oryzias latipes TaxID=8090 RepID=A0A3B3H3S8_ORYLA